MTADKPKSRSWVISQSVLLLLLVVSGPLRGEISQPWLDGVASVVGGALFVFGAFLGIAGVRHLGRNRTPYPAPLTDAELVTSGIYTFCRHPLYASLMFAGLGWALLWSSLPALIIAFINLFFFDAKARCEERLLQQRFPKYLDYAKRVKRFIPGVY